MHLQSPEEMPVRRRKSVVKETPVQVEIPRPSRDAFDKFDKIIPLIDRDKDPDYPDKKKNRNSYS